MKLSQFIMRLIATLWLITSSVNASEVAPRALDKYFSQTWSTSEGLPHNGINALSQTKDGYLWIGTWEGLARFNGREFKLFTRGSQAKLPDSAVKSLHTKKNGDLLIGGARGGISQRKNKTWHPMEDTSALVNDAIYDNNDGVWLGLEERGLVFRDSKTQQDRTIIDGLRVNQLAQTDDNVLWAATNKGLYSVKNKQDITRYGIDSGLPNAPAYSVMKTKDNNLIVGTAVGAFVFDGQNFSTIDERLNTESVLSLLQDSNSDVWLGTTNHGVFRLSELGLEKFDDTMGLPNNRVLSLFEDLEHSIWIGTNSGLHRLRDAPFITLTSHHGLAGNYVRTVLSHSDGSLWVGSSKGLNRISGKIVSGFKTLDSDNDVSVLSLEEGLNSEVLVGTYTQGVFRLVNNKLEPYLEINRHLPSKEVRSILVDSRNNTWIGTTAGVVKVSDSGDVEHINQQSGLPANFIMTIAEDTLGHVWIGTGVGVVSYVNGEMKHHEFTDEFGAEYAFSFYSEPGYMWIATDRGVLRVDLNTNKITAMMRENGLPIDKIFQIVVDETDTMWLTSNRGVIKLANEDVKKVLDGRRQSIDYQMFGEGAGMLSAQANGGSTPAAAKHDDGTIWVATANGVSRVNHQRLSHVAQYKLPLTIEKLIVDDVNYRVNEQDQISLPAGSTHLSIYYAGLGFINSQHIQYQTRLSGLDITWVDKKSQTYTEFTNLSPGQYTFSMRAKYPHGQWQDDVVSLSFTVEPFFWQTTPFRLVVVLAFMLLIYFSYHYRLMKVRHNEERLMLLVEKQTIELQQQAKSFAYQATHDQLTGLPNRRAFDGWCDSAFKQAAHDQQTLSFAIIDIDHFKRVNDTYSHLVGDQVIQIVANILLQQFAQSDLEIKLARWGGEEFTALIYQSEKSALGLCNTIRQKIEENNFDDVIDGLKITISIGLTDNLASNGYEDMINLADKALYRAKRDGRNQVQVHDPQGESLGGDPMRRKSDNLT